MNDTEKCLDSHLWHACAGGTVQMPLVNTKVYYFPQGQAEHSQFPVEFGCSPPTPALFLCQVLSVKFMADPETDEVFSKIRLAPVPPNSPDSGEDDDLALGGNSLDGQEHPTSFVKTLTQSDANNGGGFSVPRYCADTIFPRLDYLADPPVQTILAKDVHGEVWKFRHIYRGSPRRHLLTTGWSSFVSRKKLAAGDSIVFLRAEDGDLRVGIRRAKRGIIGFSVLARVEEGKMTRGGNGVTNSVGNSRGRVRPDSVIEAAALAAGGRTFEVVYYPRASAPEFCVKASAVRAAVRVEWFAGTRLKMAFETKDSSRISWFMGTVSSVQVTDPMRWPNSPWRLLQVTWDEPDLLQNVKCVSPWLVELVSEMASIHLAPFSAPRKKPRIEPHPDITLDGQIPILPFTGYPFGIQGARHAQFGVSLPDLHLNNIQFHPTPAPRITTGLIIRDPTLHDKVSCVLTIGNSNSSQNTKNSTTPQLVLFGQPILTEEQISLSSSGENSSSVVNPRKILDASGFPWFGGQRGSEPETGHCKVFMESEDADRALDLDALRSYGEPFSEFLRSAPRLTIMAESSSYNLGREKKRSEEWTMEEEMRRETMETYLLDDDVVGWSSSSKVERERDDVAVGWSLPSKVEREKDAAVGCRRCIVDGAR